LETCRALAGSYVVTVTDVEGVFSSRGLLSFTADGVFLMTDSAQAGLPGVYDPFDSAQGAWRCLGAEGDKLRARALGINFVQPGEGRGTVFGRVDYDIDLDTRSGALSGRAGLSFTSEGDLEGADPIARPGPVLEHFAIEGTRIEPKMQPATPMLYDCGDGYRLTVTLQRDEAGESAALVQSPDGELRLPHVHSGSGARYSDDNAELWTKGDEALFTLPGSEMKRCTPTRD
jgi:membrane-bound inhibitor of C-type lysozyme